MSVVVSTPATLETKLSEVSWYADTLTEIPRSSSLLLVLPSVSVRARLLEHPLSDLGDQARLLGEGHDNRRRHQPPGGVHPAQEGLDASDPSLHRGNDRLVLGVELPASERPAQVAFDSGVVVEQALLVEVEDLVAGASFSFRLVHRNVCVVEEPLGSRVAVIGEGDPDAGGYGDLGTAQDEWARQRSVDPGHDRRRL